MEMEAIRELQAYGYAFGSVLFAVILYGYVYYMYTAKKRGEIDYEEYSNMALNDYIDDSPVDEMIPRSRKETKEER